MRMSIYNYLVIRKPTTLGRVTTTIENLINSYAQEGWRLLLVDNDYLYFERIESLHEPSMAINNKMEALFLDT